MSESAGGHGPAVYFPLGCSEIAISWNEMICGCRGVRKSDFSRNPWRGKVRAEDVLREGVRRGGRPGREGSERLLDRDTDKCEAGES